MTATINAKPTPGWVKLKAGDKDFTFSPDGVTLIPRAGFEISANCPSEYKHILFQAYHRGWITPVACMRSTEYLMELLKE